MRLLIATPLFPPDTAPAAVYAKELAARLRGSHEVSVVAYAYIPEQVPGVLIHAVSKRQPVPVRLIAFMTTLLQNARRAGVLYVLNGSSAELPAALVSRLTGTPLVLGMSDAAAHTRAERSSLHKAIERFARRQARCTISEMPLPRPEILPLEPRDEDALLRYEASWKAHLAALVSACTYEKK